MTNYYVSLSGNDTKPGTTLATAWRHIKYAVNHVSAGDTIFVVPGNYGAEHVTIYGTSGTASDPIKITRYGTSGMITLEHDIERTGIGIRVYSNYWIIEHFDVSNYETDLYISGDYNTFNYVKGYDAIYGFMVPDEGEYNVFNECISYDVGEFGFRLTGNYNLIKDCKTYHSKHFAISIDRSAGEAVGNIVDGGEYWGMYSDTAIVARRAFGTIVRNVLVRDTHDGIRTYFGSRNTTIENCTITNMTDRDGIAMYGSGIVRNNVIRNCNLYGTWVSGVSADEVIFEGNDMQNSPLPEYRFTTWLSSDYIATIKNQVGSSFTINIAEYAGATEPATVIVKYTDGRTFSINGVGNYTSYTLNSIGTFNIEVTGTISGTVKDKDTGTPIQGATVTANGYSVITNTTGGYTITLPTGTYTLTASKTGYFPESQQNVHVLENQTTVNFQLTEASDLIGSWDFDEGEGPTVKDSSGYGNNGTIYGATWVDGIEGKALMFDGDDYVQVLQSTSLDSINQEITIIAWVKTPITGRHTILARWLCGTGVNERAYEFDIQPDGKLQFGLCGDGSYVNSVWLESNGAISPNTWTHVAATSDGTTMKIYINGEQDLNTVTAPVGIHISAGNLHIGQWLYSSPDNWITPFNGTIDEVRIYSRALSADEIKVNYQEGEGITGTISGTVTDKGTGLPISGVKIIANGYEITTE